MENRITPEKIEKLENYQIFVFGSNELGLHGAGAAKIAYEQFGAVRNQGFGHRFDTFAIPTKDWNIKTLPLHIIHFYVNRFIAYAKSETNLIFLVTEIGCGLAGYTPEQIAPLFLEAKLYDNIYLPKSFWDVLNDKV